MSTEQDERLQAEISLLDAMYPDQVEWAEKDRVLKYKSPGRSLQLRLPDGYLYGQLPEVLSAAVSRNDVREQMRLHLRTCTAGEEVLDSVILAFTEIPASSVVDNEDNGTVPNEEPFTKATVIIWLHHLLNTNKRKQALSPPSPEVSGVTKPGYPGVLVYSGPAKAVNEHVNELKQLNWQAFQVRYEGDEEWGFAHGAGVKEVESMKDVVNEVGDTNKAVFMEAMRMK